MVVILKKRKENKNWLFYLSALFLLVTPFLLTLLMGSGGVYRMKFNLSFVPAFLVYYLIHHMKEGKGKKVFIAFITMEIILQAITCVLLFYSDNLRYEEDKELANQISARMEEQNLDTTKPVVFIGKHTAKQSILRGEMLGYSFFEWDMETAARNNIRIHGFLKTQGIEYQEPTVNQIAEADKETSDLENWPSENAIKETEKFILVKLEED